MDISYDLGEAGWATATVRSAEGGEVDMIASYLSDSLRDLAEATLRLCAGAPEATVVFMDEPGEHHLVLRRNDGDRLTYEVRWFDDWASWGSHPPDRYFVALKGQTTVRRLRRQVVNVLGDLDETFGPEGYRERWINAEFPSETYAALQAV